MYRIPRQGGILRPNVVLAGGSLRTIFKKESSVADYDIFFLGTEIDKLKNDIEKKLLSLGGSKTYQCPQDELRTFQVAKIKIHLISLILTSYSSVENLLDSFDINASRIALYEGKLYVANEAVRDNFLKSISLNVLTYPIASFKRIVKFKEKGFKVTKAIEDFVNIFSKTTFSSEALETHYVD
jgi:hypothetical protein